MVFSLSRRVLTGVFLACAALSVPARAQTTITIGDVGAGSVNHWPAYIATEKGFFAARKIKLDYVPAPSSAAVMQQLAGGSVDMGSGGLVDPIRAIDKGAPVKLFRSEAVPAPYEVYAKPSIASLKDLAGKTIMIGGIKDVTRIYLEGMLTPNGVKPGSYDLVFAGATAQRFQALASGSIDATILNPPFNFKAKGAGFSRLGATPDYVKDVPFTGYAVSEAWAKTHKAEIADFLAAYQQGVDWFYDPANRGAAIDIVGKYVKVDRSDLEQTYDFYIGVKAFDRDGDLAKAGVGNLLTLLKASGDLEGTPDLARFVDATLTTPSK